MSLWHPRKTVKLNRAREILSETFKHEYWISFRDRKVSSNFWKKAKNLCWLPFAVSKINTIQNNNSIRTIWANIETCIFKCLNYLIVINVFLNLKQKINVLSEPKPEWMKLLKKYYKWGSIFCFECMNSSIFIPFFHLYFTFYLSTWAQNVLDIILLLEKGQQKVGLVKGAFDGLKSIFYLRFYLPLLICHNSSFRHRPINERTLL